MLTRIIQALSTIEISYGAFPINNISRCTWADIAQKIRLNYADFMFVYDNNATFPTTYDFLVGVPENLDKLSVDVDKPVSAFITALKHFKEEREAIYDKLFDALSLEYNPIENYDRNEQWKDISQGDSTSNSSAKTDTNLRSETDSSPEGVPVTSKTYTTTYDDALESRLAGYQTAEGKQVTTTTGDGDNNRTELNATTTAKTNADHEGRVHGNIGVTTTQQMLTQEIELRLNTILTDRIVQDFIYDFCTVY